MKVGKTLYVTTATQWRRWLARNASKAKEIWLVYYRKDSGKRRIPYNDAVEQALCYGWIDTTVKKIDEERFAQRFCPRRKGSMLSAMNAARVRRLRREGKMTKAGEKALRTAKGEPTTGPLKVKPDIVRALKKGGAWKNFQKFPVAYKRIRLGWIEGARSRRRTFDQRLDYFVKMTAQNKRYGMVQE